MGPQNSTSHNGSRKIPGHKLQRTKDRAGQKGCFQVSLIKFKNCLKMF